MMHETKNRSKTTTDQICFFEVTKQIYDVCSDRDTLLII